MAFIGNWIEEKVSGYLKTGIQAGGSLAGNAVGGVGSLIEKSGQSAAGTVTGGIGGVGGYINNYGEGIKRSMSADGPVSSGQKKTAVKPTATAEKTAATAQKSLPSAGGAKKALPAASKPAGAAKPASQVSKQSAGAVQKPQGAVGAARSNPATKVSSGPATNTRSTAASARTSTGASKPSGTSANKTTDGKVRVSAQSRPKPGGVGRAGTARSSAASNKNDPGDALGIGKDFSKMGNTRPQNNTGQKGSSSASQRKATAADPLAMGEDLGSMGKK